MDLSCKLDTLYLNGIKNEGQFTYETQCISFLIAFCGETNLNLEIVVNENDLKCSQLNCGSGFFIPIKLFQSYKFITKSNMKLDLKQIVLPALQSEQKATIYAGLCTVLRGIIKLYHKNNLWLLGHKLYCLKACAEVSSRTRLCDFVIPKLHASLLHSSSPIENIPAGLMELENLLAQPVGIHNMDKRQRILLKTISRGKSKVKENRNKKLKKAVVWTKDLPNLQHTFIEGVEFHLSDLAVYPCVHIFLEKEYKENHQLMENISLVKAWYGRVSKIEGIASAMKLCNKEAMHVIRGKSEICLPQVIEQRKEGVNKIKYTLRKKTLELTLKRDLPGILERLTTIDLTPKYAQNLCTSVELEWCKFPVDIHPVKGELSSLRAKRKCQQIENIYFAVKQIARDGCSIVDFCSGGGHVGIVLAYLLPNCKVTLVDNKEESLDRARARIFSLNLKNIGIVQGNLEYYRGVFDIGITLHACGIATDMVLQKCMCSKADFVVSPCCYGRIQNIASINYPQSTYFENIPLSFNDMLLLGHAADQTSWDFQSKKALQGKRCMGIIDMDRSEMAKECGYEVSLHTMQPDTCSPKNNLIFGKLNKHLLK